jgi:hypothetical protein
LFPPFPCCPSSFPLFFLIVPYTSVVAAAQSNYSPFFCLSSRLLLLFACVHLLLSPPLLLSSKKKNWGQPPKVITRLFFYCPCFLFSFRAICLPPTLVVCVCSSSTPPCQKHSLSLLACVHLLHSICFWGPTP